MLQERGYGGVVLQKCGAAHGMARNLGGLSVQSVAGTRHAHMRMV